MASSTTTTAPSSSQPSTSSSTSSSTSVLSSRVDYGSVIGISLVHGGIVVLPLYLGFLPSFTLHLLLLSALLYCISALSFTVAYHRLYAHHAFTLPSFTRLASALFASSLTIGSIKKCVPLHQYHHRHLGTKQDPLNINRGIIHAHLTYLFYYYDAAYKELNTVVIINDDSNKNNNNDKKNERKTSLSGPTTGQLLDGDWVVTLTSSLYWFIWPIMSFLLPALLAHLLFNQFWGGLYWGGVMRTVLLLHFNGLTNSLCQLYGKKPYNNDENPENSKNNNNTLKNTNSRYNPFYDNSLVSYLTYGEGYQNFNHEFPNDFRLGWKRHQWDPIKWIIVIFEKLRIPLFSNIVKTEKQPVLKCLISTKQKQIDKIKQNIYFGPADDQIPAISWEDFKKRTAAGEFLIVIDEFVHDVGSFASSHPGGIPILKGKTGDDATYAFNGGVSRHSKAARNILATLRVAKLTNHPDYPVPSAGSSSNLNSPTKSS